ncbi:MAG: FAD-binding oxidoreductase [Anaerolineae bacterium]
MATSTLSIDALTELVGAEYVTDDSTALQAAAVDGVTPQYVIRPGAEEEVAETLAWANAAGLAVVPRGRGKALGVGEPPRRADVVLGLDRLDKILEYEPADLTVTAEASATLGELQRVLGAQGQWLPLDPALGADHSLGGIIAANLSGPHRWRYGTSRDLLIGMRIVQADGMVYRGGAKVVKNVAGYDLPKLFVGSLGTLGVMTEVTFKLQPQPRNSQSVVAQLPGVAAAAAISGRVITSHLMPDALAVVDAGGAARLHALAPDLVAADNVAALFAARFTGIAAAVTRQVNELKAMVEAAGGQVTVVEGDAALWGAVADCPALVTEGRAVRLKIAVLPTLLGEAMEAVQEAARSRTLAVAQVAHSGNGVLYSVIRGFGPDDDRATRTVEAAKAIRQVITDLGGTTVVEHAPLNIKSAIGVWGPTRGDFRLMQTLKAQFDPKGTLNPGRYVGGI